MLRGVALAAVVFALLYMFAPQTEHRVGRVKPVSSRKQMPEVAMPVLSGGNWRLSEHRGKVVLVNFWATWCPPCRAETPGLVSIANRYREHGLEVAGVAMDDNAKSVVPPFASRYRIPYPILVPGQSSLADAIESLPTSILVDRQGRMARSYVGIVDERDLERDVKTLLSE